MNYTEKYFVQKKYAYGYELIDVYEKEADAIEYMTRASRNEGRGAWRVVRIMEVIVASVIKA